MVLSHATGVRIPVGVPNTKSLPHNGGFCVYVFIATCYLALDQGYAHWALVPPRTSLAGAKSSSVHGSLLPLKGVTAVRSLADAVRKGHLIPNRTRRSLDFEAGQPRWRGASRPSCRRRSSPARESAFKGRRRACYPYTHYAGEEVQSLVRGFVGQIWSASCLSAHWSRSRSLAEVRDIPMTESSPAVWTCTIRAASGGRLEMCFHDGAGNWDNNSGKNWSYAPSTTGLLTVSLP
jgi:hypothetical protein